MSDAPIDAAADRPEELGTESTGTSCVSKRADDTARARFPTRYQPLVVVLAAASLGIVVDRWLSPSVGCWWVVAAATLSGWFVAWWAGRPSSSPIEDTVGRDDVDSAPQATSAPWQHVASVLLLTAVAAVAGAWHHCQWSLFARNDVGFYARRAPQPMCVEAVVVKGTQQMPAAQRDPMQIIPRGDQTRLELAVVAIRDGRDWRPVSGLGTLLVNGHLLGVHAGDRLRVFAQLATPAVARNPGEFDRAEYAREDRQLSVFRAGYPECVSVVYEASALSPGQWLDAARAGADNQLRRRLNPRHDGLAAALLLGDREQLGAARYEAFQETGVVHLLAISGLHVAIIVLAVAWLLRMLRVPRGRAALVVAAVAVLYALLTGARPPAVRATVLVLVWCASCLLGRRAISFNSLAAAALVILAWNPSNLFRLGTQLSFLAVAVLMWFGRDWRGPKWLVPKWFGRGRDADALDQLIEETRPWPTKTLRYLGHGAHCLVLAGATVWLFSLPLIMARFHLFTPVGVVLNTLLWIPVGAALISGFALVTLGWLLPPLGAVAGGFCNLSLGVIDACVAVARRIPYGHAWVPGPSEWWLVGFYGALALLAAVPRLRPPRRWALGLLAGWIVVGLAVASVPEKPSIEATFLSVGHGSATVLRLPSGKTMLCDAGCFSSPWHGARAVAGCLWQQDVTHIDAVVLSHADADHYNALPELLERFSIGVVYVSPMMFADENYPLKHLREAILAAGVPIRELRAGDVLDGGQDCRIEVLHPTGRGVVGNDNANSLVLDVEYRGRRLLLPGDLEPPGLDDVMAEMPLNADVLLVPHHGSRRSNPPGLAAWCSPEVAVISGGLNPDPSATEAAYRASGVRVLNTARVGAVRVTIGPEGVHASSFPDGKWQPVPLTRARPPRQRTRP